MLIWHTTSMVQVSAWVCTCEQHAQKLSHNFNGLQTVIKLEHLMKKRYVSLRNYMHSYEIDFFAFRSCISLPLQIGVIAGPWL